MTKPSQLPVPHPAVLFRPISEGAVLLHGDDEVYFGLDEVGARIWQLLPPHSGTLDEVVAALQAAYPEVDAETLRVDASDLLAELRAAGLVTDAG
ncbi:PqqD family protein [Gaopeijia maritima]|uniref:PqqD family protein n=1 Tax=Gaopeijia maritima TaxID=3119007 RepID=A0ABU9E7I1_9BACT